MLNEEKKGSEPVATYTSGELAKLAGVTVRTVQYYHKRGLVLPTSISEGGRRLYSQGDLNQMKTICFLKDLGFSLDDIKQVLDEDNARDLIDLLIDQQIQALEAKRQEEEVQLDRLRALQKSLNSFTDLSATGLSSIAKMMNKRKHVQQLHLFILLTALPISLLAGLAVFLLLTQGNFAWLVLYFILAIPYGLGISRYYFKQVAYICPECHYDFQPDLKAAIFAKHTPYTRKLICPHCHYHGYCVETLAQKEGDHYE
ncbi:MULTISPECIES: MerR family transcriptional regulator [Aerococcus]|uniref:MerR family transcriptional regulator n=1 Tax=Aerococcus TaxID=1375 RepID=UPI000DCF0A5A|nr:MULTISPECIES: MerR family transcriptional regulator [Aerococcus]KAA9299157.1 MerR family transcriptional regulator [Aerococcus tenax]MDK6688387.1 MerR family transcriptional regulator [Aerococcus urinae]MDK8132556.1 MerR family transcriptional regulator [Aerococcus urinae]MDK8485512.1 MerR family transcriptional regulator [Aerococcus urinae]MDL5179193.1 MerR family transcriptional regulator [Aerococcus tenax]